MKVAYISSTYFADVDFCFLRELSKKTDVIYVLLYNRNDNATICNFDYCYHKTGLFKANIYPALNKYKEFVNLEKMYVLNINSNKSYSIRCFWAYIQLFIFLLKGKFDIIHITKPFDYFAYILYTFRKKIVFSIHDPIDHSSSINKRYLFNKWLSVKILTNYIVYNKSQVDDFFNYFNISKNKKKVLVSNLSCYNCLHANKPNLVNIPQKFVLFFGTVNTYKGLEFLFPAIKEIHKADPQTTFVIAGKGNYYFDISEYKNLKYIDIRNRFIPDDELVGLIQNCQFCILPYVDATQSGVVMSAFAFNKPCIVTNVGGLPEMVKDKYYGLVIPARNTQAIVDSVTYLLTHQQVLLKMSNTIKKDFRNGNLSWSAVANNTIEFYKTI